MIRLSFFAVMPMYVRLRLIACSVLVSCLPLSSALAGNDTPPAPAVASAHPAATAAGMEVLDAGGNAFDAAVAITAALAVVEPQGSGLGGGGFWLLHDAENNRDVMIDGREEAPGAATRDMYLDDDGNFVQQRSRNGALAAGIPGEPAALAHIAERYGKLDLARTLAPAIRLARDGFEINDHMHTLAEYRRDVAPELRLVPDADAVRVQPGEAALTGVPFDLVDASPGGALQGFLQHVRETEDTQ